MFQPCKAQPGLSGNPFLLALRFLTYVEIVCKKDWERKTDKAAQIFVLINCTESNFEKTQY